jgi:hypothetical protein
VKNPTDGLHAFGESALVELHRVAIVLVAALLAVSIAFAAGRLTSDDTNRRATPLRVPSASIDAATPLGGRDAPRLRLGGGSQTGGVEAPPLVQQPTPAPQP